MTSMHAGYSLGAITGALIGGGFAWAGVGPLPSLAAAGLAGAVADGVAGHWLLRGRHDAAAPTAQTPPHLPSATPRRPEPRWPASRRRRPLGGTGGTCGG